LKLSYLILELFDLVAVEFDLVVLVGNLGLGLDHGGLEPSQSLLLVLEVLLELDDAPAEPVDVGLLVLDQRLGRGGCLLQPLLSVRRRRLQGE